MANLVISYDERLDYLTIEGTIYSGEFFRSLGKDGIKCNVPFEIFRRKDGVVRIREIGSWREVAGLVMRQMQHNIGVAFGRIS